MGSSVSSQAADNPVISLHDGKPTIFPIWRYVYGGIILAEPELGKVETTEPGGWNFLRVQFKIWPGQGTLIETIFRQQITYTMKTFDPNYADWMVTITYRAIGRTRTEQK